MSITYQFEFRHGTWFFIVLPVSLHPDIVALAWFLEPDTLAAGIIPSCKAKMKASQAGTNAFLVFKNTNKYDMIGERC